MRAQIIFAVSRRNLFHGEKILMQFLKEACLVYKIKFALCVYCI